MENCLYGKKIFVMEEHFMHMTEPIEISGQVEGMFSEAKSLQTYELDLPSPALPFYSVGVCEEKPARPYAARHFAQSKVPTAKQYMLCVALCERIM